MLSHQFRHKRLLNLLPHTSRIRNVSIVAHVDHGKTTLADCLLSSNNIIHKKQAGQLRILDDRLDEQDRGITMKSSSVSLLWQDHLINLIDSPGHLEFYSEVSSALRLTDAALLVVDTVEGVSSQTFRVLSQLYTEKLPSVLVLNKIDKLVTHCKMDPSEAYHHLAQLIQQVNAILGSFIAKEVAQVKRGKNKSSKEQQKQHKQNDPHSQEAQKQAQRIKNDKDLYTLTNQTIDQLQSMFYFSPQKKNIIFASALDNWGFTVNNFGPLIASKLNRPALQIQRYLWGDFYYNPKTKQFQPQPRNDNDRPVCVQWIIKPIWDIFEYVAAENKPKIDKIIATLQLKISETALKTGGYQLTKEILNSWLPLDRIVLQSIVEVLPNPKQAQQFRLVYLLQLNNQENELPQSIVHALSECSNSQQAPLIAFVAKMVNIPHKQINERGMNKLQTPGETKTLGFGRIFSGRIKRGSEVIIIAAKRKKITNEKGEVKEVSEISRTRVDNLYIFNAQFPDGVLQAYAGNIVGFGNLQTQIFKSGTLSTRQDCISFVPISSQTKSILKVSVSTPNIQDNAKLLEGLKRLNRSDPSVDVYVQVTGDIILNTCGQVHLQKCVVDLQQIYCKVPIRISQPIITFRETIIWTTLKQLKNEKYIGELDRKRKLQQQRLLRERHHEEKMIDKELDEQEKEKLKYIEEWVFGVEKYESEDLTVEDTRYFLKSRNDEEERQRYDYKREKELKKVDHKNRGRMHAKQTLLNLSLKTNRKTLLTPNQRIRITVRAVGMHFELAEYLERNLEKMKKMFGENKSEVKTVKEGLMENKIEFMKEFMAKLREYGTEEQLCRLIEQQLICFGPNGAGSNLLLCRAIKSEHSLCSQIVQPMGYDQYEQALQLGQGLQKLLQESKTSVSELLTALKLGFALATEAGPLCNQQMMGVVLVVEEISCVEEEKKEKVETKEKGTGEELMKENQHQKEEQSKKMNIQKQDYATAISNTPLSETPNIDCTITPSIQPSTEHSLPKIDNFGPLAGQIISTVKFCFLQAFLGGSPRLVQPMYLCELHTDQQYYGSIHNELSKRRAQILSQDLHEFSNVFIIKAYLPMLESHNLCFDILDKTQGTVNAQLDLDTWKVFNQDPFYTPLTAEQIEEQGLQSMVPNAARILLQKIRQNKGLVGTQKIVVSAEKQRTLKKN